MFRDMFFGLIIGFFIGTLLINLIKITFYLTKAIIILIIAILRKIADTINIYKIQKQNI